jgi:transcription elongation factor Elf1
MSDNKLIQQGWECPKCGKVYSPNTFMCWTCGQNTQTNTTADSAPINQSKWTTNTVLTKNNKGGNK